MVMIQIPDSHSETQALLGKQYQCKGIIMENSHLMVYEQKTGFPGDLVTDQYVMICYQIHFSSSLFTQPNAKVSQ